MKRSRGRGRRQQNPVNRSYDSNGPDVRVRGNASQVFEKYQTLGRDAMSSGDRVMAENYLQHAEHYYRIMLSFQPAPGEGDRENDKEAVNGDASGGHERDENSGAEPLVLVRESDEDGGDEKPAKPSRRRGPLRKKRNGDAGTSTAQASSDDATEANVETSADASPEASPDVSEATVEVVGEVASEIAGDVASDGEAEVVASE